jgi:hypothetical protein
MFYALIDPDELVEPDPLVGIEPLADPLPDIEPLADVEPPPEVEPLAPTSEINIVRVASLFTSDCRSEEYVGSAVPTVVRRPVSWL